MHTKKKSYFFILPVFVFLMILFAPEPGNNPFMTDMEKKIVNSEKISFYVKYYDLAIFFYTVNNKTINSFKMCARTLKYRIVLYKSKISFLFSHVAFFPYYLSCHITNYFNSAFDRICLYKAAFAPLDKPSPFMFLLFVILGFIIQYLQRIYRPFRDFFDIIISIVILSLSFPLLAAAAILIKLDSPGPVLFKQKRVGLNRRKRFQKLPCYLHKRRVNHLGNIFCMYKFRTMHADAESKTGAVWTVEHDKRITRVGRFLRKTRIDELPQLFNVLKGEMSFIGPRPERPEFVGSLNSHIKCYFRRYHIKPGITGLAQVRYRYTASIKETRKKLRYDLLYLEKMCFIMDLIIIFDTFKTVLLFKGAR